MAARAAPAPVVVVGGGPAGLATARAYREAGGSAPVILLCAESRRPYRRPPLTKEFLRGRVDAESLAIEDDRWYESHDVDVRLGTRAVALDPVTRTVTTSAGQRIHYSGCVLCTGSEPVRPPVPGAGEPGVELIRTVDDSARLAAAGRPGARIVVVGSGFIGCEAAASLAMRGVAVMIVTPEAEPQTARLGAAVGTRLRAWLSEAGVEVLSRASVAKVRGGPDGLRVALDDGTVVGCDRVVMAVGARPRVALARAAGARIEDGAVVTDATMRTGVEGVWCAGDAAFAVNASAGRHLRVEHWGEALRHGEVAGRNLAGSAAAWDDVPGFWSTIGHRTLKQAAWGDGWDDVRVESDAGGFTAWYGRGGRLVGVLTHERDDDYARGAELVRAGAPWPAP